MYAGLFVVATPIGNIQDISSRALDVLHGVDLIAAEDTRHSARLLQQFNVETPLVAYHDHSDQSALERILARLAQGRSVALISDAGTPLISDPGYRLVRAAQELPCAIHAVPGACALVAGLSVAGLPTDRFRFEGFPPNKSAARRKCFEALRDETVTLVFYEAPHRVLDCLADMCQVFGDQREAAMAREVTKTFETVRRGALADLFAFVESDPNQRKGEFVLLVEGRARREESALDQRTEELLMALAKELPAKRAAALVANFSGLRKNALYDLLLQRRAERAD